MAKIVGTTKTFTYPNFGQPDGFPSYTAHSGQTVRVLRRLTAQECDRECGPFFEVEAADGWRGHVAADELSV